MDLEFDQEALVQTFLSESQENLLTMEDALLNLEVRPADEELIHTVFRMAHSLKGDAGCVGFSNVRDFAHALENLLDKVRDGSLFPSPALITRLLQAVDALRQLIPAAAGGRSELSSGERELLSAFDSFGESEERTVAETTEAAHQLDPSSTRTLRVDKSRLDEMLNLTGEIAIARGRLRQILESLPPALIGQALEAFNDSERMSLDLQELIMRVRMVPVGPFFRQQVRVVRDLANAEGKQARLVIEGADAEIDNNLLDQMRQPLTHMLRNALHHGIESPEARRAAGKDPVGRVTLRAYQEAGAFVIELSDDGRGINRESLRARAIAAGEITEEQKLSDEDVLDLMFRPGISTADAVTETAGRGVGMDVVRRNVELLHGSVEVSSVAGTGTTIVVRLPLTLAIIDGFGVIVAGERYIIPHEYIVECVELPMEARAGATGVISLRDQALPFLRLGSLFDLPEPAERQNVVVVECNGLRAGLAVDALQGHLQIVIKPLSKLFGSLRMVAGSAILGDGRVALILDIPSLLKEVVQSERAA